MTVFRIMRIVLEGLQSQVHTPRRNPRLEGLYECGYLLSFMVLNICYGRAQMLFKRRLLTYIEVDKSRRLGILTPHF